MFMLILNLKILYTRSSGGVGVGADCGDAFGEEGLHLCVHGGHLEEFVGLQEVVGVQLDETHFADGPAVLGLDDESVDVELQRVVPEVGVGQVCDARGLGPRRAAPLRLEGHVLAAFPVVDPEAAVACVLEEHVDGPGDLGLLVVDGPLGAEGPQEGELRGEVVDEL